MELLLVISFIVILGNIALLIYISRFYRKINQTIETSVKVRRFLEKTIHEGGNLLEDLLSANQAAVDNITNIEPPKRPLLTRFCFPDIDVAETNFIDYTILTMRYTAIGNMVRCNDYKTLTGENVQRVTFPLELLKTIHKRFYLNDFSIESFENDFKENEGFISLDNQNGLTLRFVIHQDDLTEIEKRFIETCIEKHF